VVPAVQRTLNTHVHVRSHDSDFEWQTNQRLHLGTGYGGLSILASKTADNAPEDPTQVGCNCNTNYAGTQVRVSCLLGADLPAPNNYVYSGTLKIWSGSNGLTPYKHANTSTVLRLLAEFDQFFFFFFFFFAGVAQNPTWAATASLLQSPLELSHSYPHRSDESLFGVHFSMEHTWLWTTHK
jgi:hypothetical protein